MADRIPVTDADLAKEHRLRGVRGPASVAITHPALRICLTNCAELRKRRHETAQSEPHPDRKRIAAGDND